MENTVPLVEIDALGKRFAGIDRPALSRVSGKVLPGGITGLVGPDGAGKTTLIRLLVGLLLPDEGQARVAGFDTRTQAASIHGICGYMPQKFGLYEDLSVMENLRLYADLRDVTGPDRQERFQRLLDFTALEPFKTRLAGKLSGGMKQKLGLACALLGDPKVLLLDEPSVGVDPISRRELWKMVQQLLTEGMAVIWSTSYLDEAENCHSVILLNEGEVLYSGPPADMVQNVRGRTWLIRGMDQSARRDLLMKLLEQKNVTDAVIQGASLRVVAMKGAAKKEVGDRDEGDKDTGDRDTGKKNVKKKKGKKKSLPKTDESPGISLPEQVQKTGAIHWERVEPRFEDAFIDILGGGPSGTSTIAQAIREKPASDVPVIHAESLSKHFGDFVAVKDNSFSIDRGEIFGLLGPNGAGKSTTFKMLCGLLQPSSGAASIMGIDLKKSSSEARSRIGYMAQKFSLYNGLSVLQNLKFFSGVYGLSGKKRKETVDIKISLFNLKRYLVTTTEKLPLGSGPYTQPTLPKIDPGQTAEGGARTQKTNTDK